MSENNGIEFGNDESFYLVKHEKGYTFFKDFHEATIDIHDNRYNDDSAVLLEFVLTNEGQFKVEQKSWKEIVRVYKEGDKGKIKEDKTKKVDEGGKKTPTKKS